MSWLLCDVLIDLTDKVTQELKKPFGAVSTEMVCRGLYHYAQALKRGKTCSVWEYLAAKAKLLGIVKQVKKP